MICDGRGCSVIAHLNCYFSAGSKDANDTISDIEHWHCENCGGLPRHMHPRPRAAKTAGVSFDPDLEVVTESPITEGVPATGHQGGGWGGHWQTRTEMPQLTTGKGKEAMEDLVTSQRTLEDRSASLTLQPDHDVVGETTTCYFCRRADLWLYFTCAVCQLTTHAKCYYRLGSDEATYYETNISDWRCQDCGGPQRHAHCAISDDGQGIQRQAGNSYHNLGGGSGITGEEHMDHDVQTANYSSTRTHFGKPRPPRSKKKPPVRDKTSHHQRIDAAGQGTRPSAQSKH
jgi:hypothetical protein